MAAACATRLPHPRPGRAVAVGWSDSSGKTLVKLISQLISISRGRSAIRHLWTWVMVAVTALRHPGTSKHLAPGAAVEMDKIAAE